MNFNVPMAFPKFSLGKIVMSRGISCLVDEKSLNPQYFLLRHVQGDWSDMDEEDHIFNTNALHNGGRIFSLYDVDKASFGIDKVYVITESDRSVTTVLLPSEC